MIMLSKFSNFPDELSENDELREYELSGSDCINNFVLDFGCFKVNRTTHSISKDMF